MDQKNEIQVFNFNAHPLRIVDINGEHWWVAKDVCDVLDIDNVSQALSRLDDDERNTFILNDGIGNPGRAIINEPGLYSLILGSRKPEARAFKRWVTHEVLPSLNRNGFYVTGQERGEESATHTLLKSISRLEQRITSLEASISNKRYRRALVESATRKVQRDLPSAPPFSKIVFYPVSRSFDAEAQEFVAEHIKNAEGYGAKKHIWDALQELASECGWKIGSQASFYRVCDALSELLETETGIKICG